MNWAIRCTSCGDIRVTSTSLWNAAHKGAQPIRCKCEKKAIERKPRRATVLLTHQGITLSVTEWAEKTGLPVSSMYNRIHKRKQMLGHQPDDSWVIFGISDESPIRKDDTVSAAESELNRIIRAIEAEATERLQPIFVRAVSDLIKEKVKPLIAGLIVKGVIDVHKPAQPQAKPTIPEGCLIAKDADYALDNAYYDPSPHPDDDYMLGLDTFRNAREYVGDDTATTFLEAHKADPNMVIPPLTPKADQILADQRQADIEAKEEALRQERLRKLEEKKMTHFCVIPEHLKCMDQNTWHEFKIERPIPPEFTKQEDTVPLTREEADAIALLPWWQNRIKRGGNYAFTFGWVCHTQYERILAWHTPTPRRHPMPIDSAAAWEPSYDWVVDHRLLNEVMAFLLIAKWCDDGREKQPMHPQLIQYYKSWSDPEQHFDTRFWPERAITKLKRQAERLLEWMPEVAAE